MVIIAPKSLYWGIPDTYCPANVMMFVDAPVPNGHQAVRTIISVIGLNHLGHKQRKEGYA